jgi:hypothetical protein
MLDPLMVCGGYRRKHVGFVNSPPVAHELAITTATEKSFAIVSEVSKDCGSSGIPVKTGHRFEVGLIIPMV